MLVYQNDSHIKWRCNYSSQKILLTKFKGLSVQRFRLFSYLFPNGVNAESKYAGY